MCDDAVNDAGGELYVPSVFISISSNHRAYHFNSSGLSSRNGYRETAHLTLAVDLSEERVVVAASESGVKEGRLSFECQMCEPDIVFSCGESHVVCVSAATPSNKEHLFSIRFSSVMPLSLGSVNSMNTLFETNRRTITRGNWPS